MDEPGFLYSLERLAGVWATAARVYRTHTDFTVDFLRDDPSAPPPGQAVLVARVAMSPATAGDLLHDFERRLA
jgi:hypothetical protein